MGETHIQPGTVLADKYRVDEVLGEGGMGVVVRATHLLLDEPVALKFLLPELAQSPQAAARFLREAKAAMRIRGEHVAQVLDVGRLEGGEPYIVMEYLRGRDLDDELEARGPLPIAEAVDAVLHACRALHSAHAAGIVHRDIKPANLFKTTTPDGQPLIKVLDFGISKLSGDRVDALTKTSTTMGSALYMSPEQLKSSRDVDHRTDIYALGVTLYQLLTGEFPFMAETMPQLVAAVLSEPPEPLSARRRDIPPALEAAVARAMAREPSLRHPSASELARALAPFGTRGGQASLGVERDGTRPPHGADVISPTVPRGPGGSAPGTLVSPGNAPSPPRQATAPPLPHTAGAMPLATQVPTTLPSRVDAGGDASVGQLPPGFDATGPPTSQTIPGATKSRTSAMIAVAAAALLLVIAIPVAVLSGGDDDTAAGASATPPVTEEEPAELPEELPEATPTAEDEAHEADEADDAPRDDEGEGGHAEHARDEAAPSATAARPVPRPVPHAKPSPKPTSKPAPADNIFDQHK